MAREDAMAMSERGSMRGMNGRERRHAPAGRPARMACAALLSCALAACGGGDGSPPEPTPPPAQAALTVTAGDAGSGSVSVAIGSGDAGVVGAGASSSVAAAGDTVTLTADPADGWTFAGWTLSPQGLACADGLAANPCVLAAGSLSADATVEAAFVALSTLTVAAGANGSVAAVVGDAAAVTVAADSSRGFTVSVLSAATLTATAAGGYAFAGWTLSGGLSACAGDLAGNPCVLAAGSLNADATAEAAFEAVQTTLTVAAGANGSVAAVVGDAVAPTVAADSSRGFTVSVLSAATLTATAAGGYAFAGWTLSPQGLACAAGPAANPCVLAAGSLSADATAEAAFVALRTLTVAAGANGSVAAVVGDAAAVTVAADSSRGFTVSVLSAATLTATAAGGYAFAGWTLSGGLSACAGDLAGNPCVLAAGSLSADATAEAAFEAVQTTLTVAAGANGSVAAVVGDAVAPTVAADSSRGFTVSVLSAATLTATAAGGYAFAGWTLLPQGLACAAGPAANPCVLAAGSLSADATAEAAFVALSTLTVTAAPGGSVEAAISKAAAVTVAADSSRGFTVSVLSAATLTATAAGGYAFAGWTLSGGLSACAGDLAGNPCVLAAGSLNADATAEAAFVALSTLTVTAAPGGSVEAAISKAAAVTVAADSSRGFTVSVLSAATLTATAAGGYAFAGWTLSGGLSACAGDLAGNPCVLAAGSLNAGAMAEAAFEAVQTTLTVAAGANGSVAAVIGDAAPTVAAGSSQSFSFSVLSAATLTATAAGGYAFAGWTLSGPPGLACGGMQARICELPAGSVTADATVEAAFARPAAAWRGPGSVSLNGSTHTAVPYAPGAFENWAGAPCDGSAQPECDVSSVMASASLPAAVFRPFAVGGIKSLAFGLGYHGDPPDHFEVSFRDASDAGFTPVPGLGSLAPGSEPARLPVPVHLLPWGVRAYLTEACDAANSCEAADDERTLEQPDSVAATGYFKAPNADANDQFGWDIALSGDGATLAVGTPQDDSASTGTFAPGEAGYQAALDSDGANNSGAVTVYRRSGSTWRVEAFVKTPVAGDFDAFGGALALSRDGATLAVGARFEDSASTGTFAPGDEGYQAALDSDGASNSGAVTVYRRSGSTWRVEAFVKAPKADIDDGFGDALALSGDGATLAVGAPEEDSASTGTFAAPDGEGYQAALDDNGASQSGAVTVYRRSDVDSRWTIEAFIKAPNAARSDRFGYSTSGVGHPLALSADGATLAVSAVEEDSASTGTFAPNEPGYQAALDNNSTNNSGAVTVYRRSGSTWRVEAFIKAPEADHSDNFGRVLALDGSGATLAVSMLGEDSASTGTFVLGGEGYQAALDSNGANASGAVIVYRRSDVDSRWTIEAFIKAPNAAANDNFGLSLDLSSGGVVMAVGSSGEDSSFSGVFAPDDPAYQAALDEDMVYDHDGNSGTDEIGIDAGAAYIYRHPPGPGAWTVGNFVKAPKADVVDSFGSALALSDDGATLAVGAINESGGALSQPAGGRSADTGNALNKAGAVYLY